ncbi:MAG: DUF3299 domain-containing protein [Marinobacter sp.]|nr:DUF3299 domain-containing protein [Marinobacter sp.]
MFKVPQFSAVTVRALALTLALLAAPLSLSAEWREVDWLELMPEEDVKLLESLPEIVHEGDGPFLLPDEIMTGRIVPEMDGVAARIPGFVVPLKVTGDMRIIEFFLVPYYGACIHVPPPPPNQIIHVTYAPGFTLEVLYDPFWIQGVLRTETLENDIARASYTLEAEKIERYVF